MGFWDLDGIAVIGTVATAGGVVAAVAAGGGKKNDWPKNY